MNKIATLPLYVWVLLAVALMSQAAWIFRDASKRGENKWLWGLYGLTNVPSSLIVYLLVTRVFLKGKMCTFCKKKFIASYSFCPYCGEKNENSTSAPL